MVVAATHSLSLALSKHRRVSLSQPHSSTISIITNLFFQTLISSRGMLSSLGYR